MLRTYVCYRPHRISCSANTCWKQIVIQWPHPFVPPSSRLCRPSATLIQQLCSNQRIQIARSQFVHIIKSFDICAFESAFLLCFHGNSRLSLSTHLIVESHMERDEIHSEIAEADYENLKLIWKLLRYM